MPRDLALLRRRAEITERGGDLAGSLAQFRAIERDYPGDLETYLAEARLYGEAGRLDESAATFERALRRGAFNRRRRGGRGDVLRARPRP